MRPHWSREQISKRIFASGQFHTWFTLQTSIWIDSSSETSLGLQQTTQRYTPDDITSQRIIELCFHLSPSQLTRRIHMWCFRVSCWYTRMTVDGGRYGRSYTLIPSRCLWVTGPHYDYCLNWPTRLSHALMMYRMYHSRGTDNAPWPTDTCRPSFPGLALPSRQQIGLGLLPTSTFEEVPFRYCHVSIQPGSRVLCGCSGPLATLPRSPHLCQNCGLLVLWRMQSSGMLRRVTLVRTDVSEGDKNWLTSNVSHN
jgi:hypothetical protein